MLFLDAEFVQAHSALHSDIATYWLGLHNTAFLEDLYSVQFIFIATSLCVYERTSFCWYRTDLKRH